MIQLIGFVPKGTRLDFFYSVTRLLFSRRMFLRVMNVVKAEYLPRTIGRVEESTGQKSIRLITDLGTCNGFFDSSMSSVVVGACQERSDLRSYLESRGVKIIDNNAFTYQTFSFPPSLLFKKDPRAELLTLLN